MHCHRQQRVRLLSVVNRHELMNRLADSALENVVIALTMTKED